MVFKLSKIFFFVSDISFISAGFTSYEGPTVDHAAYGPPPTSTGGGHVEVSGPTYSTSYHSSYGTPVKNEPGNHYVPAKGNR